MRKSRSFVLTVLAGSLAAAGLVAAQQRGASTAMLAPQDQLEIHELYARYSQAYDLPEGDAEAWASTFTADGAMGSSVGRQACATS